MHQQLLLALSKRRFVKLNEATEKEAKPSNHSLTSLQTYERMSVKEWFSFAFGLLFLGVYVCVCVHLSINSQAMY